MEKREKLYILVPLMKNFSCFLDNEPPIIIFELGPINNAAGTAYT
jgi:hypothetical protein